MRIVVVGPGALGSLFAARLILHGKHEVTLLDHDHQRAALLNRQGLLFDTEGATRRLPLSVSTDPADLAGAELVLLCVKAYAVPGVLPRLEPHLGPAALLLAFQNGIGHLGHLAVLDAACSWGIGVTTEGATMAASGHVRHGGHGITRLGFLTPASGQVLQRLNAIAALFTAAGLASEVAAAIREHLWQKLLVNAGINALTALYDCPNGALLDRPDAQAQLVAAVQEGAAVAAAEGVVLGGDPVAATLKVCRDTAANISSMLQDVRKGRRTEIDAINGAVVAAGARLGISTPVNAELARRIRALEQGVT